MSSLFFICEFSVVLSQIMQREQVPLFSLCVMLDVVTLFINLIPGVLRDAVVLVKGVPLLSNGIQLRVRSWTLGFRAWD